MDANATRRLSRRAFLNGAGPGFALLLGSRGPNVRAAVAAAPVRIGALTNGWGPTRWQGSAMG